MNRNRILITIAVCFASFAAKSQYSYHGSGFQSLVTLNPAAAGAEGDGTLRMIYTGYYPGRNLNLHFLSVSYDTYIPVLHGGIAVFVSDNYLGGIINNLSGGFSYSYHLQAGRNLFINAGLSAALRHRGLNVSKVVLPDQIDPLRGPVLPPGETLDGRGRTFFDVGTGFMLMSGKFISGISVNHLSRPDAEGKGASGDQLPWRVTLFTMAVLNFPGKSDLNFQPVLLLDRYGKDMTASAGGMFGNEKAAAGSLISVMLNGDINLQTGLSFKIAGGLFFYNYCFNLTSANGMLPLTVHHQAGMALSLNNVDKRKVIKTIKFPGM